MNSLSVVVPYFQRERGILPKAIKSALRQEGFSNFDIIIVDDGSPVPAREEILDLICAHPGKITIIEQKNMSAGVARNTALNSLPLDRRYVALLDSDDEWEPHHLATAIAVLMRGCDCYFSNLYSPGEKLSKFEKEDQTGFPGRFRPEEMRPLDELPDCYEFCGDMFDRVLFTGNRIMPSTLVYNFQKFPSLRFHKEFRRFGDELLFFADIAVNNAKFGFSTRPGVRRGHGVNVYDKAGWGTPGFLERLCDEMAMYKYTVRAYPLTERQQAICKKRFARVRSDFVSASFGHLARFEFLPLRQLLRLVRLDPSFPLLFVLIAARLVGDRLWKRASRQRKASPESVN